MTTLRNQFIRSLLDDMRALEIMLQENWFEDDIVRIGAEQELVLINKNNYKPSTVAPDILAANPDLSWLVGELARFNLEINLSPLKFTGDCIRKMELENRNYLDTVSKLLAPHNADYLLTGILPTFHKYDLDLKNLSPNPRYFELIDAIKNQLVDNTFELRLVGIDELLVRHDSALMEACNTSFQVHLQVSPAEFVDYYNCALALAAPCIAIASNSPVVFGKRLWHETRIALFQQAIDTRKTLDHMRQLSPRVILGDDWIQDSVMDIFKEDLARFRVLLHDDPEEQSLEKVRNGITPKLKSLQLHNSTIYRWNRPCYGISDNGKPHLRIENRVFPAGPTVTDEFANMAFWLGAMVGLKNRYQKIPNYISFEDVRDNFGKAARFGIDSKFTWFNDTKISAKDLFLEELIPAAREGLQSMAIEKSDIDHYLGIITDRTQRHMTGARWILRSYSKLIKQAANPDEAKSILTKSIYQNQRIENNPVHLWPEPHIDDYRDYNPSALLVSELMKTNLFTVQAEDLIILVAKLIDWQEENYMPVEDKNGNLLGVISVHQIAKVRLNSTPEEYNRITVKEVMDPNPEVVAPNEKVIKALAIMDEKGVTCLPVIKNKELLGLITEKHVRILMRRMH